jgi:circadian clock protein KaiC
MIERLSSGSDRLDAVLHGGLPTSTIALIVGLPGSGKTILAEQYMYENATMERPGMYLSTVSEPLDKLVRFGQSLGFFDSEAIGHSVFYDDLGKELPAAGLSGVLEGIDRLVKERRPGLLVIDSFKALTSYANDERGFRDFIHTLAGRLSVLPLATFWVGEYAEEELSTAPEFAVADTVISLRTARAAERELRVLQVLKLRGSGFASGSHAYRISTAGIDVFPRLADPVDTGDYSLQARRVSSGVPLIDEMLEGGYFAGSTTLLAGPTGVGKTVMGLHFIFEGAAAEEPGLIASMDENPPQLERMAGGFGWSLDQEGVTTMYRSPVDLYVDEWVYDLLETIEGTGARRVLIDGLTDLEFASADPARFREYMYSLGQRCSRAGTSVLMTLEVPELFRIDRLSQFGTSRLADNVLLLEYGRKESEIKRTVTVLKSRSSSHDPGVREFTITPEGIALGPTFEPHQDASAR